MKPYLFHLLIPGALLLSACAATPQSGSTTREISSNISLPPNAKLIAYGAYDVVQFAPPPAGGTLYVYDEDAARVPYVTSYAPSPSGEMFAGEQHHATSAQLSNLLPPAQTDAHHHFRVYYVPLPPSP